MGLKPRKREEQVAKPLVLEQLHETIALLNASRLAQPGMTKKKLEAEDARHAAKFDRRMAKARAKWERMTILERQAWGERYLKAGKPTEGYARSLPRQASELADLFAVVTIAERDNRKRAKETPVDYYELHRPAPRAADDGQARATSPSPVIDAPAGDDEASKPGKPRRRRRGPAVGPIGYQIDGVLYPSIFDEDD